ncbi:MAG: terpene cyclase/mutase family protein [Pirellulales bacterium]|nr:terpene cyclase/mutase family protein [Pirellulales bacterium]
MEIVRNKCVLPKEGREGISPRPIETDPAATQQLAGPVRRAIGLSRQWLLSQQQTDGHFVAELEGDSILESEYILLLAFLGREKSHLARRAAERLVQTQLRDGGWAMYPGGGVEISGSVKAYFALKLTGHDPGAEYMQRARRAILAHGGADAVNSYTRFYLALLGQISYEYCPAVPPEVMLAPKWSPINLYAVSAWSRTIIVPLSVMWAHQPVRQIDPQYGIRELFIRAPQQWPPLRCPDLPGGTGFFSWDHFFRVVDRAFKWCQRHRFLPLRRQALKKAEQWMLARFQGSDGLGAIFPPIVWSVVALRCLGYADDSPEVLECHRQLDALILEDDDSDAIRLQPCKSPVWDTAITLRALVAAGVRPERTEIGRATDWLLAKQILRRGDWSETVQAEPGGWAFEYANDFYPDVDDTAMALMALQSLFAPGPDATAALPADLHVTGDDGPLDRLADPVGRLERSSTAIGRGLAWILAMQNDDGGWGAFDRNNNRRFLCCVPFADHNAMIDPSTPDLTGHVLGALGELGRRVGDPAVDRAIRYLRATQEANGSWFGRWGVNYLYGTGEALTGLAAVGIAADDPMMKTGANWLLACQQPCGGWGESADSYARPECHGQGPATVSQTAWAVMGLLAAGLAHHPAVARGIQFLVERQEEDGSWDEPEVTGTGFPRVFYLRYHYYPIYFPLLALSRWAVTAAASLAEASRPPLRIVTPDGRRRPHAVAMG